MSQSVIKKDVFCQSVANSHTFRIKTRKGVWFIGSLFLNTNGGGNWAGIIEKRSASEAIVLTKLGGALSEAHALEATIDGTDLVITAWNWNGTEKWETTFSHAVYVGN